MARRFIWQDRRLGVALVAATFLLVFTQACDALAALSPGQTQTFKAGRPGLSATIQVRGHRIGFLQLQVRERCVTKPFPGPHSRPVERFAGGQGITILSANLPIRDGRFAYRPHGNGSEQLYLSGHIHGDRLTGRYRGWYVEKGSAYEGGPSEVPPTAAEHYGEEYRCGTRDPHGLPMKFTARLRQR
jgi:hypothetical protein